MPKTTIFLGILLCFVLSAGQTFALSDAEYNSLAKSSSEFRQADKELNKFWKVTIGQLDGDYKKQVLNEQRQWVKTGWDKTAQKFMAQGLSKSAAYTKAIQERINQLRVIQENSALSENEMGSAKADDFYNAQDDDEGVTKWPDNCGVVKAAVPIDDSLNMILLERQNGEKRTFYYYHQPDNQGVNCGKIVGLMCFEVLQELPITTKLRQAGVKGDKMTLIHECVAAD